MCSGSIVISVCVLYDANCYTARWCFVRIDVTYFVTFTQALLINEYRYNITPKI